MTDEDKAKKAAGSTVQSRRCDCNPRPSLGRAHRARQIKRKKQEMKKDTSKNQSNAVRQSWERSRKLQELVPESKLTEARTYLKLHSNADTLNALDILVNPKRRKTPNAAQELQILTKKFRTFITIDQTDTHAIVHKDNTTVPNGSPNVKIIKQLIRLSREHGGSGQIQKGLDFVKKMEDDPDYHDMALATIKGLK